MHEAIKSKPKTKVERAEITEDVFKALIHDVYDIMLNYTRVTGKMVTKTNPILIGNATFWFNTNEDTGEAFLSFEPSVHVWKEELIRKDLDQHYHDLYYNVVKR